MRNNLKKVIIPILLLALILSLGAKNVLAQASTSSVSTISYVPLIGITSVPDPLVLPSGEGNVTYHYAVKNFLSDAPLSNVQVVDDSCNPVKFITGDDNSNSMLDFSEVWRYSCVARLSKTTENIATATGIANNMIAKHSAYSTVVVGSNIQPPLVSIVNITKVPSLLILPPTGNNITFTYKVTNPGVVSLGGVIVTDDKCSAMSGKLGDTNANNLLDIDEVWIYSCSTRLIESTTSTANVIAYANGLRAIDNVSLAISVDSSSVGTSPLFDVAISPNAAENNNLKIIIWGILSGVVLALLIVLALIQKDAIRKKLDHVKLRVKNNHDETPS